MNFFFSVIEENYATNGINYHGFLLPSGDDHGADTVTTISIGGY